MKVDDPQLLIVIVDLGEKRKNKCEWFSFLNWVFRVLSSMCTNNVPKILPLPLA
jgi:metal-sulfur cluster biosynthetic enzyme